MITIMRRLKSGTRAAIERLGPDATGVFANYAAFDLKSVDRRYREMHDQHRDVHNSALGDIAAYGCVSVAEIACGSGFNCNLATANSLSYTGIDISETAVAVACLKEISGDFINLPVDRLDMIRDRYFDAVYNSSMLEHIGFAAHAIGCMWRLARQRLDIMFYEGLTQDQTDTIRFFRHPEGQDPRDSGGYYGVKVAQQNHGAPYDGTGYFLNRYSEASVRKMLAALDGVGDISVRHFAGGRTGQRSIATALRSS